MKILNIDALELLKNLPDNSIDLIYTDPPYFINQEVSIIKRSNACKYKAKSDINFKKDTDWDRVWQTEEEYLNWIKQLLIEMKRIIKSDRHIVMWFDRKRISFLWKMAEDIGMKGRGILFWKKINPAPMARGVCPAKTIEMAMWITNGKPKQEHYNYKLGLIHDVIEASIPRKQGARKRHPTQKPLRVVLFHILYLSKPGDVVLDPFAGSGTTGVACKLLNRDFILGELNKEYYDLILDRLNNLNDKSVQKEFKFVENYVFKHKVSTATDEEILNLLGKEKEGLF